MNSSQQVVPLMFNWIIALTALWIAGYGTARIIGQHSRYVALSQRTVKRVGRYIWSHFGTQLAWFVAGIMAAFVYIRSHPPCG